VNDEKGFFCLVTSCTKSVSERSRWGGNKCGQSVPCHDAQRVPFEKKLRDLPLEKNYSKEVSFLGSKLISNSCFLNLPELNHSLTLLFQLGIPSSLLRLDIINSRRIININVCRFALSCVSLVILLLLYKHVMGYLRIKIQ